MPVYKRGEVYWYEFKFNGERVRESTRQGNKNVATQMMAAKRTQLAKGEVGIERKQPVPTVREFSARFKRAIETLCAEKPRTITFYQEKLDRLLEYEPLAAAPIDSVDEAAVEAYRQQRSRQISRRGKLLAPASVNRELATLRRMLRLAQEWKVIARVPRIRLGRGEQPREFVLSHSEEQSYLGAVSGDLSNIATFLLDTGLRVGEALRLEWADVRMEPVGGAAFGYLTVRARSAKNSKSRNIPLSLRVSELLNALKPAKTGLVFHREDGRPLSQTWLNQQHSAVRKLLKFPDDFVPHSFRHTFGTRLGEAGADAFSIMKLMGHSTVTVSQRYVHPSPEVIERAFARMEALNKAGRAGLPASEKVPTISPTVTKRQKGEKQITH